MGNLIMYVTVIVIWCIVFCFANVTETRTTPGRQEITSFAMQDTSLVKLRPNGTAVAFSYSTYSSDRNTAMTAVFAIFGIVIIVIICKLCCRYGCQDPDSEREHITTTITVHPPPMHTEPPQRPTVRHQREYHNHLYFVTVSSNASINGPNDFPENDAPPSYEAAVSRDSSKPGM